MSYRNKGQMYKELKDGQDVGLGQTRNNPFFILLLKYQGDLMCASPGEIAEATRRSGTPGEAIRARREALRKYERLYDSRGVFRGVA